MMTKSMRLGLTAISTFLLSTNVFAATAVDDTYQTNLNTAVNDVECGLGHPLNPGPEGNDTFTARANIDFNAMETSFQQTGNGPGFITTLTGSNDPSQFYYFPFCGSGNDGTFTEAATFSYDLVDNGDSTVDSAIISILPPAPPQPPSTSADTYNEGDYTETAGPGTGEFTYILNVSPLANDNLTPPYD